MMPTGYGKLAGDDGRTTAVAFLEDLEQIVARERIERFQAPVVEERYGRRSTIVTSQLPIASWHHVIADPTYADAILDRLVHNAHRLDLDGDSMRRSKNTPDA